MGRLQQEDGPFAFGVLGSVDNIQSEAVAAGLQGLSELDHRSMNRQRLLVFVEDLDPEKSGRAGRVLDAGIAGREAALGDAEMKNLAVFLKDAPRFAVIAGGNGDAALEVDGRGLDLHLAVQGSFGL